MGKYAERATAYQDMVDLLSTRHIKGAIEDEQGGVCLVGAVRASAAHPIACDYERLYATYPSALDK